MTNQVKNDEIIRLASELRIINDEIFLGDGFNNLTDEKWTELEEKRDLIDSRLNDILEILKDEQVK